MAKARCCSMRSSSCETVERKDTLVGATLQVDLGSSRLLGDPEAHASFGRVCDGARGQGGWWLVAGGCCVLRVGWG